MEPHMEIAMRDMTGLPVLLWDGTYPSTLRCPTCLSDLDLMYRPGYCDICHAMTAMIIVSEPGEVPSFRLLGPMLNPPWGSRTLEQVQTWIKRVKLSDRYRGDVDVRLSDMLTSLEICENVLRYGRGDRESLDLADRCFWFRSNINRYLTDRLPATPSTNHTEDA